MLRLVTPVEGADKDAIVAILLEEIKRQYTEHSKPKTVEILDQHWDTVSGRVRRYVDSQGDVSAVGPSPFHFENTENLSPSNDALRAGGELLFARYDRSDEVRSAIVAHAERVRTSHCPYCGLPLRRKPKGRSHGWYQ